MQSLAYWVGKQEPGTLVDLTQAEAGGGGTEGSTLEKKTLDLLSTALSFPEHEQGGCA